MLRSEDGATVLQFICGWIISSEDEAIRQKQLVRLVITKNADVTAPPHGPDGKTALEAICGSQRDLSVSEDHRHELIRFLLKNGAQVNREPGLRSKTALQYCAERGDLTTAALLIQHGADPNVYPCPCLPDHPDDDERLGIQFRSTLDMAVSKGRLDMTQYLLNIGALSAFPGGTGYQGVLELEMDVERRYGAVKEAVRRHAIIVKEQNDRDFELLAMHQTCIDKMAAQREARLKRLIEYTRAGGASQIEHEEHDEIEEEE